ncbi:hypothetical protein [Luteimonas sp. R10]|uniref:hypothetical protein n=1 Tax=Luteimonas sp. R10 TaxID=3108176 RepID=UPI0030935F96|nr:hypothetical protein U3649_18235 [Luteimonas sp. R10]
MKPSILFAAAFALALSACQERPQDAAADPAAAGDAMEDPAAPPPLDQPEEDVPPATAADAAAATGSMPAEGAITFGGFGPAAFGADQEQVRMAWGKDLGDAQPSEPGGCYYLMPQPQPSDGYRLAFMIEGDRFSRIDVRAGDIVAPGGGRVGMSADEIEALYPGRVERRPHKYVEGAWYLRIPDEAGGEGVLLFATDEHGRVTEWRVGVPPQVDYVEGCS